MADLRNMFAKHKALPWLSGKNLTRLRVTYNEEFIEINKHRPMQEIWEQQSQVAGFC